jgi:hypothetical protein
LNQLNQGEDDGAGFERQSSAGNHSLRFKDVFNLLTAEKILTTIRITHGALVEYFGEE